MLIRLLCGLCLPDLKIIQAGEKLCISFAVIFLPQRARRNYARLNESSGQAKSAKPGIKGIYNSMSFLLAKESS
jgi:hypothetical protein